jgi:hypothetical protein
VLGAALMCGNIFSLPGEKGSGLKAGMLSTFQVVTSLLFTVVTNGFASK